MASRTSGDTKTLLPIGTSSAVLSVSQTVIRQRSSMETFGSGMFRCDMLICAVASSSRLSGRTTITGSVRSVQHCLFQCFGIGNAGWRTSIWVPGRVIQMVSSTVSNRTRVISRRTLKVSDGSQPPGAPASPLGVMAGARSLDRHGSIESEVLLEATRTQAGRGQCPEPCLSQYGSWSLLVGRACWNAQG